VLLDLCNILSISIDGDIADIRVYDEAKTKIKVDAFMELLAERKERGLSG
jgi:hypothetical protein